MKAGLTAQDGRAVLRLLKSAYGAGLPTVSLRSIYFDTPVQQLKAHGIALRIRREKGRWIQTIKTGRTGVGGYQDVLEQDNGVPGPKPRIDAIADRGLRETIVAAIRDTILVPQFETRVRRTRWRVSERHGEIEIAYDRGHILCADRTSPILELEMELTGGSPEALFNLAERLLGGTSACLSLPSKAARGYALAAGRDGAVRPVQSKPNVAAGETGAGGVFEAVLKLLAGAIAANLFATMVSEDPEGPHQLRVALRRFRSSLRLFAGIMDRKLARDLNRRARDIGRAVSALRDCDVMTALVLEAQPRSADSTLQQALEGYRADLLLGAREALLETKTTQFVLHLQRLAVLGGWQSGAGRKAAEPMELVCRKPISSLWSLIVTMGDRLSVLTPEERHKFRKLLKRYRYITEITVVPTINSGNIKELRKLQEALGVLNDLSVLASWAPALTSRDAEMQLEDIRSSLDGKGRRREDLALGRACRHWLKLRSSSIL